MDARIRTVIGTMLTNLSTRGQKVFLTFDTGDRVEIAIEDAPGADNKSYQWLVVKINDEIINRS